ncbi:uncharacterized protein Triagg1_6119 [Trichoderma aggressivum f. europaeum]|uniref:GPI inositol-deacylase winged helix domain-containing protein n=1 Tax=Trichoderma aggressivum f. europaeum TaxID=173218 RepID=A0AAE1IDN3_9HYPO|nr:hypothetical protein Triagg1_6119 [Trichoderma aggressivum f. europaeum]
MISTFPSIKFGLMVGIGGGIAPKVRLGDVVVSTPTGRYPGVIQWDYGKTEKGGRFKQIRLLNNPPALLRTALTKLTTENELNGSKIPEYLDEIRQRWPRLVSKYTWSESIQDPLHAPAAEGDEGKPRETRVYYDLIASGNQVIKDANFRNSLNQRYNGHMLYVEIKAARFLLAQLYFETIKTKKTLKKLENILAHFPTGQKAYDFAYEEAVRRIQGLDSDSKELAWLVLSWITCANRPLTTEELQHALAVKIGRTELDEENLIEIEDMVLEYFKRTQNCWFPAAQTEITIICVTYLSFSAFDTGLCERNWEFKKRLQLFPFYSYTARNWGDHAPKDKASQEVIEFLKSPAKVEASSQALTTNEENYRQSLPKKTTGLHLAGFFGLHKATDTLLELGYSPNERDACNREPLWYAAQNGHEALVKLLLARGAIVNITDGYGESPLFTAVEHDRQGVVEQLLAAGADVNLHSPGGRGPLLAAAKGGHQKSFEMLSSAGAGVNSPGAGSALLAAAEIDHQKIVEKLLAAGANVNASNKFLDIGPALAVAVSRGDQEIVDKLLAAGAKFKFNGRNGGIVVESEEKKRLRETVEKMREMARATCR